MKNNLNLDKFRVKNGPLKSDSNDGPVGAFIIPSLFGPLQIICGVGDGWEHVSVTYRKKKDTPTWDVMCFVKELFWEPEEAVIQIHPPRSEYVTFHPYVLHLWRPTEQPIPLPPSWMVGPVGLRVAI